MFFFIRVFLLFVIICGGTAVGIGHIFFHSSTAFKGDSIEAPSSWEMALSSVMAPMQNTKAGLILSSRVAQNRGDLNVTREQLSILYDNFSLSPQEKLGLFGMALVIGDYEKALNIADVLQKEIVADTESIKNLDTRFYDLPLFFLIADAFKKGNYGRVTMIADTPYAGIILSSTIPIIKNWIRFVDPETAVSLSTVKSEWESPTNISAQLHEVWAAEYAGKIDIATDLVDRMSRQYDAPQISELLAAFYMRHNKKDKAMDVLRRTLVKFPDNEDIRRTLNILRENGSYKPPLFADAHTRGSVTGLAIALYDYASSTSQIQAGESTYYDLLLARIIAYLDPELPSIFYKIGDLLAMQEQWNLAIEAFDQVNVNDPDYVAAQIEKADILIKQKKEDDATIVLENLIKTENFRQAEVYFAIGNLYRKRKDYTKALEAFDRAEIIVKNKNKEEELPRAQKDIRHNWRLQKSSESTPPELLWQVYYWRAITLDSLGRWKEAEHDLYRALEIRPENPFILNYLGYGYADRGINLDKANEMIAKAVDRAPEVAFIVDSMGWVLFKQNDIEGAIRHLERAAELEPYHALINEHLGDSYWKTGRRIEAYYMWQRAVDYADLSDDEQKDAVARSQEKLRSGLVVDSVLE